MSRNDLARQRLKEVRTLQGWREAYKLAGLPDDDAKPNTKVKRLSRLLKRDTGGFQELDSKQKRRINRSYRSEGRKEKLADARSDRYIKSENKRLLNARRKARRDFGADGLNPNPRRLKRRLEQFKPLDKEAKERIRSNFDDLEGEGGVRLRREYAKSFSGFDPLMFVDAERANFEFRKTKAERAAWRDSKSDLDFDEWNEQSEAKKYGY
jgi:hypothetical protein